ncbi:DNA repair protein RecO [Thauera linaloolentis]|uniref:DNA repair protein RecO n=1 Tax=Thauera linaloolentis (strain DSM 12138 / JCM 21573 / CCUG 41526 / CIP 105981 / IAM 15112 / NBRC 102519 / 47Lol) TaxID=1123367 RepID=N6Z8Q4_THAL4|nr:DNA repair protein RecO [Thauera linaloolentis]ENO88534.1 DNA repair protein RecO [Thauera linaloolentis 47Lol = DSM 12138]MCM8564889.1 DNA repair protein RecO [Thauera linaloolentis]
MSRAPKQRVEQQPAWVLHTYPWRETSLIVEVFSRDHGRVALVAKGARRPYSQLRGVLMAFQPLAMDWSGGGEVKTLVRAEWQGGQPLLTGRALICGYYLNELLVRLTAREDAHPRLFAAYADATRALGRGEPESPILRRFELALLQDLGYEAGLAHEADSGDAVRPEARYLYIIERGPVRLEALEEEHRAGEDAGMPAGRADLGDQPVLAGQTLLDMAADDFSRAETLAQSKLLLRMLINHTLGGQPLQSRRVLKELQEL